VYFADTWNNRVRRIDTSGTITTFAGTGAVTKQTNPPFYDTDANGNPVTQSGYNGDNIAATSATLNWPFGVAVDSFSNVYISDYLNWRIRKVANGVITTVAGNGQSGYDGDGGSSTVSYISDPANVNVDVAGNVYIVDQATNRIRKVFPVYVAPKPPTDLDGDGIGDLTVWRPGNGTWFSLTSSSGYSYAASAAHQWGNQSLGDKPFIGDLDGDHIADLVIWRASTGTWYWLTSSSGYSTAMAQGKQWGNQSLGDVPMLADIDGDGKMDLVLWRASTGTWFWLTSSSGYNYNTAGSKQWGNQSLGDVPKLADVDGDGKADLIVWRASSGTWFWLTSSSGYNYNMAGSKQWGNQSLGDVPLTGDIDGDGRTELIVWRASTGTWFWLTSSSGYANSSGIQWGNQSLGDVPLPTDIDGDGKADLALWRASTGTWFWLKSSAGFNTNQAGAKQWGSSSQGDMPVVK
jgi:hypothetical protein